MFKSIETKSGRVTVSIENGKFKISINCAAVEGAKFSQLLDLKQTSELLFEVERACTLLGLEGGAA